ncbi:MAG: hypothetical protein ACTHW3_10105 [Leucobacter sp.]
MHTLPKLPGTLASTVALARELEAISAPLTRAAAPHARKAAQAAASYAALAQAYERHERTAARSEAIRRAALAELDEMRDPVHRLVVRLAREDTTSIDDLDTIDTELRNGATPARRRAIIRQLLTQLLELLHHAARWLHVFQYRADLAALHTVESVLTAESIERRSEPPRPQLVRLTRSLDLAPGAPSALMLP